MRIIAGRFRRRQLLTNPGMVTRPITDRVKEALFQRIEPRLVDSRVADIFSGTGTIGLEALSRGAHSVVFVENDRRAIDLLKQNIAKLGVDDQVVCWQTDALRSSYKPRGCPDFIPFDFIFFDPPYRFVEEASRNRVLVDCLKRLGQDSVSAAEARLVVRIPEHSKLELPAPWHHEWEILRSGMRVVYAIKCKDGIADPGADNPVIDVSVNEAD